MRATLLLAGAYNLGGGVAVIFLLERIAPLVHFEDGGNMLFRLFTGRTAVAFGTAYLSISKTVGRHRLLLAYGTAIKYWAFLISLYGYLRTGLSIQVLLLFGGLNLVFALLFTRYFLAKQPGAESQFSAAYFLQNAGVSITNTV